MVRGEIVPILMLSLVPRTQRSWMLMGIIILLFFRFLVVNNEGTFILIRYLARIKGLLTPHDLGLADMVRFSHNHWGFL